MNDVDFLLKLVHRGLLLEETGKVIFAELQAGGDLDMLLEHHAGLSADVVERWRRTDGGEIPEIPGYEILGKAGTGGTADVWRAREKKTGRVLALKVLKPEAARHAPTRAAFVAEAKLLEQLAHKGLVAGQGVARFGQVYFSRMEFIEGHTLLELLEEGNAFDETAALKVVLGVAEVLAWLAEQGVIHRDIKPGNIMLSSDGTLKLIDLGFAGKPQQETGAGETTVGTVQYLSPEQAQGGAADMRSDIYSLGVTLFHLVLGRLPFESSDDEEVLRMQVMQSLKSPELKSKKVSHQLQYFIEKMMAKDLEARYQSWTELDQDVRAVIEGQQALDFEGRARAERRRR
jgi:serine/threonine protein kinase